MDFTEPQILDTGRFGQIQVVQTWVMREKSISKLTNGAYIHTSGLPVSSKKEITEVIPPGREQDEALYWFDHRDEEQQAPGRRIIMNQDGSFVFDDGEPITSISEITQALKPGPHQEVVIRWFITEQEKKAQTQLKEKPGWQKPAQGEEPLTAAPKGTTKASPKKPKKNVKKPAASAPAPAQESESAGVQTTF